MRKYIRLILILPIEAFICLVVGLGFTLTPFLEAKNHISEHHYLENGLFGCAAQSLSGPVSQWVNCSLIVACVLTVCTLIGWFVFDRNHWDRPYSLVLKIGAPICFIFCLVLISFLFLVAQRAGPGAPNKNVILISIDTLRADRLGCYGYFRDTSPNIDKLAQNGAVFTNAYSQAPCTAPSHMTIMTSLLPEVHGVKNYRTGANYIKSVKRVSNAIPTLADLLKDQGYATAAFTCGGQVHGDRGFDKGFDLYDNNPDKLIHKTLSWISNNKDHKFFLFFHTFAVHTPYLPPKPYNRKFDQQYKGKIIDSWDRMQQVLKNKKANWTEKNKMFWQSVDKEDPRDLHFLNALYDGQVSYIDEAMMKPMIETLKKEGIFDDTIFVFTSDHGEAFKEHDNWSHNDLYHEVLHVPLIIHAPGLAPHIKVDQLVRSIDIMPTILDLLNIETSINMQGKSLTPAFGGKNMGLLCYSSHFNRKDTRFSSLRNEDYTYILQEHPRGGYEVIYDRKKSPKEMGKGEIKDPDPKIIRKLKHTLQRIEQLSQEMKVHGDSSGRGPDKVTLDQLKALGY